MSQKYHNIKNSFPKGSEITNDLFKALVDQDLIVEVDIKEALEKAEFGGKLNPFDRAGSARRIVAEIQKAVVVESPIKKSIKYFYQKTDNILEKAYGGLEGSEGEVRTWGGKTYKKVGKTWKYVGKDSPMSKLIDQAHELGTKAFKEGRSSVPVHDPELMKMIGELSNKTVGSSIPILNAWLKAWHKENATTNKSEVEQLKSGLFSKKIEDLEKQGKDYMPAQDMTVEEIKNESPNPTFTDIKSKPSVYGPKANLYEKPAYFKDMTGENVFEIGGRRWQYVWADYNGKIDIGVYSLDEDIVYGYDWFNENVLNKPH